MILTLSTIHTTAAQDFTVALAMLGLAILMLQHAINKGPRRKQ